MPKRYFGFISLAFGALCIHAATVTVTTLTDENDGSGAGTGQSLREAIDAAAGGDTIDFDAALFGGGPGTMPLNNGLGDLIVDKSLTIAGPGSATLTLSGGGTRRLFQIIADVDFAISGVTLADGLGKGGDGANGAGGGRRRHGRRRRALHLRR